MKKTEEHTWKPGDLYIHGYTVYMYITNYNGISSVRLNDGDGLGISLAAVDWWEEPEAKFVCNMQDVLNKIEDVVRKENKHAL